MATHESPEVRRAQIIAAALDCFGQHGFHSAKMDDIVKSSGLSKGAIYWHFKSKEEIFFAIFEEFDRAIFADWDDIEESDLLERIFRQGEMVLGGLVSARPLLETWSEFMKHPKLRERMAAIYVESRRRLQETIQEGIDAGTLLPCNPDHLAGAITALIEGFALQTLVDSDYDAMRAWPEAWKVMARGLRKN